MIREQPRPTVVRDATGTRRFVGRRAGELVHGSLLCPDGHRFPRRVLRGGENHFPVECSHTTRAGLAAVHWLYLLPTADGGTQVLELHRDEVQHIVTHRLSVPEVWAYLTARVEGTPLARGDRGADGTSSAEDAA